MKSKTRKILGWLLLSPIIAICICVFVVLMYFIWHIPETLYVLLGLAVFSVMLAYGERLIKG